MVKLRYIGKKSKGMVDGVGMVFKFNEYDVNKKLSEKLLKTTEWERVKEKTKKKNKEKEKEVIKEKESINLEGGIDDKQY